MTYRSILGTATTVALIASLLVSLIAGTPSDLPSIAMGSAELLHIERTIAICVAYLLLAVVLTRAWRGQLPNEVSGRGLKYATQELKAETRNGLEALTEHAEVTLEELRTLRAELDEERAERRQLQARVDNLLAQEGPEA